MSLTQGRLKELLSYDSTTGVFRRRKSCGAAKGGEKAGCLNGEGYLVVGIDNRVYLAHRLAWLYTYGYFPEYGVDHINRAQADNRIENLREASRVCNARNTGNFAHNTSGVKGVTFFKRYGKWMAQIAVHGKMKGLGYYRDFDNAVCARLAAEQCLGWAGCDSNSPARQHVSSILGVA